MKYFRVRHSLHGEGPICKSIDEAKGYIDGLEDDELGTCMTIEVMEMTEEEFNTLPEWQGW